ncbi:hypothetical protein BGX38DRAFT_1263668 [Terfezia claveryi]|nr:hypothetical protein BGX38DRAFT_1263668 [Terfezia claveryi]
MICVLDRTLGCYRELMMQRDIITNDLTKTSEANHRNSFYFCLLRNHSLVPHAEFKVIKPDQTNGRIDLVFQVPGLLIVTEWKFYQIQYLNIPVGSSGNAVLARADTLRDYTLPQILELRFGHWDRYHGGTIQSWVMENEGPQLRDYNIKSAYVQQLMKKQSLELRAHLVIIVWSRHIMLWYMDKEGRLAAEPRLVEMPSRPNRP